jgi:phosphohistidine phosphatase
MRRLMLLRHAKAERSLPGAPDRERGLVERGRNEASLIGGYMVTHAFTPDRVLVSPAVRTQETWKCASAAFRSAPSATTVERLYDASAAAILAAIKEAPANANTLLVIGHNPGVHEVAVLLIASGDVQTREQLREKLPTCGLVIVDFAIDEWARLHPHSGRLERFVTPKSLDVGES